MPSAFSAKTAFPERCHTAGVGDLIFSELSLIVETRIGRLECAVAGLRSGYPRERRLQLPIHVVEWNDALDIPS